MAPARKGDLIVVERTTRDYVIGQGSIERTSYHVGIVASSTRNGVVKTWHDVGWGDDLVSSHAQPIGHDRAFVASRSTVDVDATMRAAKAHHWPNHPGQPMPFESLDDVRAIVVQELADAKLNELDG